ncbi:MAG: hypothetical protein ACI4J1_06240 [Ruminiclostridium sp.]
MKTMKQSLSEITADKALSDKLVSVSSEQQLEEFLKENNVDCTKEQFRDYVLKKADDVLPDEQIEADSGGNDFGNDFINEPGKFLMKLFNGFYG